MRKNILILLLMACLTSAAQNSRHGRNGNIVFGTDSCARAVSPFSGTAEGGAHYSNALKAYKDSLPEVNVYSMIIPIAIQFYCPEEEQGKYSDQRKVIGGMYKQMNGVKGVDVLSVLEQHTDEEIYARTDHHWLPKGAYYAAKEFARVAGVPFKDLSYYDEKVVHNFVGTMYKFSGDIRVKNSPEEFVYYTPRDTSYVTTFVSHTPTKTKGVYTLSKPFQGSFFIKYKDGSPSAYCTFMGGDTRTTHVKALARNGRKLLIIKDSFGNAIPGYLFYSFEDIYVTDFRYFQANIIKYAREKGITDLLVANNMQHAYSKGTSAGLVKMLNKK